MGRTLRSFGWLQGVTSGAAAPGEVRRIAGPQLETLILDRLQRLVGRASLTWNEGRLILRRVQLGPAGVEVKLDHKSLGQAPAGLLVRCLPVGDQLDESGADLRLMLPVRPVFRGGRTWLVTPDGATGLARAKIDPALTKALWQAHRELARSKAGPLTPEEDLVEAQGVPDSYLRRLIRLAVLAPDIQRAILEGRQPAGLTLQQLMDQEPPIAWPDQRQQLGFAAIA